MIWNALALDAAALLVGLPLGIAGGRSLWTAFAHDTGFLGKPISSALTIALVALAAIGFALAVALQVGHSAARTRPAAVLRSE